MASKKTKTGLLSILNEYPTIGAYYLICRAICHICLGENEKAFDSFRQVLFGYNPKAKKPMYWDILGLGNENGEYFPETFILVNSPKGFENTLVKEILQFQAISLKSSIPTAYVVNFLQLLDTNQSSIPQTFNFVGTNKKSFPKRYKAINHLLIAIKEKDDELFNENAKLLLEQHEKSAKYGSLRGTPEGYLSLTAMAFLRLAELNGMVVNEILFENTYVSEEYLKFLSTL